MPHVTVREKGAKARIRPKFQVTIPKEVREAYGLEEGQFVVFSRTSDGYVIKPMPEIDPDQAWFWSPQWAAMERKADEDFRSGRVTEASSAGDAIRKLKKRSKK